MKNNLLYTFEEDLAKRLKNPAFRKVWEDSEPEYLLAKQLIEKRLQKKLSQRALAKKLHTTQAVISRLETMQANPSLNLLKRIAVVFDTKLTLRFH
ncbi:helix-turn-helix transcriptional regulator [Candidatus Gottesmanbacteria bacterium]|nr:helix-turn-helix transcriptional regulator [Candidatus Gottesmanbacteria bacterium]